MPLQKIFQEIRDDLPWVDRVRLIVGPSASRETVKDAYFDFSAKQPLIEGRASGKTLPAWAIQTLPELAAEILRKVGAAQPTARSPVPKAISAQSRVDAVFHISKSNFAQKISPQLTKHLENRQVAKKVAHFLVELDRHFLSDQDLEALVEVLGEKSEDRKKFIELIATLWRQGHLPEQANGESWSDGDVFRQAIQALEDNPNLGIEKIYLWAFLDFTPLEEVFLQKLSEQVKLEFLFSSNLASFLSEKKEKSMGEIVGLSIGPKQHILWNPHSAFDEIAFLKDALRELQAKNVLYSEVALFVPNDDLYKRVLRHHLTEWNVPLRDPTLKGEWKDKSDWVYCRDFLKVLSSGLKQEDLRSWLKISTEKRKEFFDILYAQGFYGGVSKLKKIPVESLPEEAGMIFGGVALFGRSLTPEKFLNAVQTFCQKYPRFEILNQFAEHLSQERPYLNAIPFRLSKITALFEEYLEAQIRKESRRNLTGLQMVSHGVLLPSQPRYSFVLSANKMADYSVSYDLWEWEGLEVRGAWQKLHFGLPRADRIQRDQLFLEEAILGTEATVVSAVDYTLQGKPISKGVFFTEVNEQKPFIQKSGGHASVGWDYLSRVNHSADQAVTVHRPDSTQRFIRPQTQALSMRVSEFEDYLRCPFLFYARHVLKLERENELGLDPASLAQGKVLHEVLEQWMRQDMQERFSFETGLERLNQLVEAVVTKLRVLPGIYSHPHLLERSKEVLKNQARKWLEWEFKNRKDHPEVRTLFVEKPLELQLSLKPGLAQSTLLLRGKVDRVDTDGVNAIVVDYKTGSKFFRGQELLQGLGVQLLAYLTAVWRTEGLKPAGAYYLSLKQQKVSIEGGVFQKKFLKKLYTVGPTNKGITTLEFEDFIQPVFEHWAERAQSLLSGDFTANPARPQKECPTCAYKKACGYKAQDVGDEGTSDD